MAPRDRVYFLAKDPHWTLVCWELAEPRDGQLVLRIFDVADPDDPDTAFDVEVTGDTDHWYLRLPVSGRTWQVRLGTRSPSGELHVLADSNPLSLPPEGPSDRRDESWSTVPIRRKPWKSKAIS
jgi:hypothetical protein